jgi:hypothetical protein
MKTSLYSFTMIYLILLCLIHLNIIQVYVFFYFSWITTSVKQSINDSNELEIQMFLLFKLYGRCYCHSALCEANNY